MAKPSVTNSYPAVLDAGHRLAQPVPVMNVNAAGAVGRREVLQSVAVAGAGAAAVGALPEAASAKNNEWEIVDLPFNLEKGEAKPILFDIEFDNKDPMKGWIVGSKGLYMATFDGGKTWKQFAFGPQDEDDVSYRYTQCSAKDGEIWIIGKPTLLLRSRNTGKNWERVPLSPKLPGEPTTITALGDGKAEMATSAGGIYYTENGGQNWKAQVKETIDATLNRITSSGVSGASYFSGSINSISRDDNGTYVAVSQRGNFYLTYVPGDDFWIPHNRESSRRITTLGFVKGTAREGLWQTTAGGDIWKTPRGNLELRKLEVPFDKLAIRSAGVGILDVNFEDDGKNAWAVGGSGIIFRSEDGGATWRKDRIADDLPTNLYKVKFFGKNGFILGSDGVLLQRRLA